MTGVTRNPGKSFSQAMRSVSTPWDDDRPVLRKHLLFEGEINMKSGSNLEKILKAGHFAFTGEVGPPRGANVEALREKIAHLRLVCGDKALTVTLSIGLAVFPANCTDKPSLIELADTALYRAKNSGRNKTVLWSDPIS